MIIVDEEHDQAFKQQATPRYQARDLAILYAHQLQIPIVLGSATPSLESWANAQAGRYRLHRLTARPGGGALPQVTVVDMRQKDLRGTWVSPPLIAGLAQAKERGHQSIVLLNRRGWASKVFCRSCGTAVTCTACDLGMTYHRGDDRLRCHYCGGTRPRPVVCPTCQSDAIGQAGIGTEQLVTMLTAQVPGLTTLRLDADTVRGHGRGGHDVILSQFAAREADCLVGTQMVAKGLDLDLVTFVGVVGADLGLGVPDFRAGRANLPAAHASRRTRRAAPGAWTRGDPMLGHPGGFHPGRNDSRHGRLPEQ
ncbi:MAG: primosomal protein N' [Paludibaculum sp.]